MARKIPPHAERVFKGLIYDVYHWEQEMFDGSKATFECLKRMNTVVVLPLNGDTVFYSEQEQPGKPPFLGLFGGRADPGEEPLDTAKRELLEEAGLASDDWSLLRVYGAPSKVEWDVYLFVARGCTKVAEPNLDAGGEKIAVKTCSLADFMSTLLPNERFMEKELRTEIYSAFNAAAADKFLAEIKG